MGSCFYCGDGLGGTRHNARTRDHVVPRSRGGANRADNMVLACSWCNISKGSRLHHEWVNHLASQPEPRRLIPAQKTLAILSRWEYMVTGDHSGSWWHHWLPTTNPDQVADTRTNVS